MLGSLGMIPGVDLIKEFTESVVLTLDEEAVESSPPGQAPQ
jgi:hypothetical protein